MAPAPALPPPPPVARRPHRTVNPPLDHMEMARLYDLRRPFLERLQDGDPEVLDHE